MPISGDLAVGGHYQLEGNAGGVIERCAAPEHLAVTWEYGEMVSWLQVHLHEADGGTTLELVHEAPVDPGMWEQFGPGAVGVGWDLALLGFGRHLESGAPSTPPRLRHGRSARRVCSSSSEPARGGRRQRSRTATTPTGPGPQDRPRSRSTRHHPRRTRRPDGRPRLRRTGGSGAPPDRRAARRGRAAGGSDRGRDARQFGISQPAASQHLRVLREAGLVTVRPEGTRRIYGVDVGGLAVVQDWLAQFADPFAQPLDALETELARGRPERRRAASADPAGQPGSATEHGAPGATA